MRTRTTLRLRYAGAFIGILVAMMLLLPALTLNNPNASYTGLQVTFGHEFLNWGNIVSAQIEFSIPNMIAYFLPLVASLCLVVSKRGSVVAIIIFLASSVMLFWVPEFTVVSHSILDSSTEVYVDWNYGYGLMIAILLSVCGAIISTISLLYKAN